MKTYNSDDKKSKFSFEKVDFLDANGQRDYAYAFAATSSGFSARASNLWFEEKVLRSFIENFSSIASQNGSEIVLAAMSEFKLTVRHRDGVGHFDLEFYLESPTDGNFARIMIRLNSQDLIDFANDLRESLRSN